MGGKPIRNVSTVGITATPSADTTASGIIITLTAGSSLVFGDICYIASSGKAVIADADTIATGGGIAMSLGVYSDNDPGSFLLHGIARNDAWSWTVGGILYLSTTAGSMVQTPPNATDNVVQVLGVATHADRVYFNPSLVQIEHA